MYRMFALRPGVRSAAIRIDLLCAAPASCQGRCPLSVDESLEVLRERAQRSAKARVAFDGVAQRLGDLAVCMIPSAVETLHPWSRLCRMRGGSWFDAVRS